ncbi:hypothetical protein SNEBB_002556 [Seison nebaliae]|nr:hypothetical protein SNEBB_002556 [Seison nebaliae]
MPRRGARSDKSGANLNAQEIKTQLASLSVKLDDQNDSLITVIVSEFNKSLNIITDHHTEIVQQLNDKIVSLENKLSAYEDKSSAGDKAVNDELMLRVRKLEEVVDNQKCFEKRDIVIMSGDYLPETTEGEDCAGIVRDAVKHALKINLKPEDISVAHRLGRRPLNQVPDKRKILFKLSDKSMKTDLFRACRSERPRQLYLNESLTPTRGAVHYVLRQVKRDRPDIVAKLWTRDGAVRLVKAGINQHPIALNTRDLLEDFLRKNNIDVDNYSGRVNWPSYV